MRGKRQDLDAFIDNELDEIEQSQDNQPSSMGFGSKPKGLGGASSKPAFAMGGKKPNAFAKPSFGAKLPTVKQSNFQPVGPNIP